MVDDEWPALAEGHDDVLNRRHFNSVRVQFTWIRGLILRRPGRFMATAAGVALAVGLLASLGSFVAASKATMTQRAIETVAVDWQVEVQQGADSSSVAGGPVRTAANLESR